MLEAWTGEDEAAFRQAVQGMRSVILKSDLGRDTEATKIALQKLTEAAFWARQNARGGWV